jgi:hypothetical protein
MGRLNLTLEYDHADLLLTFLEVRAFRVYWDGDAVSNNSERPRGPNGIPWQFLLVENSHWLAGSDFLKNYGPHGWDATYKHFRVMTMERHIDVLARSEEAQYREGLPRERTTIPITYILRVEPSFVKSISAIRELVRERVPLLIAKRQIERLIISREIVIDLPALEDPARFEGQLRELGVVAIRQPAITLADRATKGS